MCTLPHQRVQEGWKRSTILGYNAAVKKFKVFKTSRDVHVYDLPITASDVYSFVAWARRGTGNNRAGKINATTLTHYLHTLKAWHTFHDAKYLYQTEKRVKLMLKGSGRQDALIPARPGKSPVLISDLAELFRTLSGRGPEAEAVKDLAVVAFWGMARMAKLTYTSSSGQINLKKGTTTQDVLNFQNMTTINVHEAKTAKPGEVQVIKLRSINSPLCPVEQLSDVNKQQHQTQTPCLDMKAQREGSTYRNDMPTKVGGATLQHAVGININEIKSLGRWTTDCYKRYVKPLSREEVITSLSILELQSFSNST
ncbi:hypothetical protein PSTG_11080 [Puccinia striiformis f. sp. tritici PST-78]|uniref:Core-binding (CB) domain-containing protein n=1 Tax=Puccinia striiformis f. sp. tritici PST-78 TaxID=1165861 RepID=A0A0L0V8H8_9BASI|nr:hypothetical protein PSTG_11080 [Puccinia striiformis f. sp. tritici PST-78]